MRAPKHPAKSSAGTTTLLLELDLRERQVAFGLFRRQVRTLGRNGRSDLLQAILAHGLGEDGIGLAERG
jgi:hypothetical protein